MPKGVERRPFIDGLWLAVSNHEGINTRVFPEPTL